MAISLDEDPKQWSQWRQLTDGGCPALVTKDKIRRYYIILEIQNITLWQLPWPTSDNRTNRNAAWEDALIVWHQQSEHLWHSSDKQAKKTIHFVLLFLHFWAV